MKKLKIGSVFLDTTFLLPFFQININVEAFTLERFKEFLTETSQIHFSELSIFEAKAKLHRLSKRNTAYRKALEDFGANLKILRGDEKFTFHPYTAQDDKYFNIISSKNLELDAFDTIIVAQALKVGTLVTEDREILNVREQPAFSEDPLLRKIEIKRWKELKYQ
ncbi:MAG: PIN domain-containing protein [Candidatus Bathyarchaeia archaeon]